MTQLWWWIGDPKAPAYVSVCLSAAWGLLALYSYRKSGITSQLVFYVALTAVRLGMAVGHGK